MKNNHLISSLRAATLVAALLVLPAIASANDNATTDRAAQVLATRGSVSVSSVGGNVERGTYLMQVTSALGEPIAILSNGAWLYDQYAVDGSKAAGTLVVRFIHGRVSDLTLVSNAAAVAMQTPKPAIKNPVVASK